MRMSRYLVILSLIFVVISSNVPCAAQTASSGEEPPHKHLLTTNPFLILFSWWNIEYEYKIAKHSTLGFAGSYYSFEDDETEEDAAKSKYYSGYLFYRHYPSGHAPTGFYFGARLGITAIEIEYLDDGITEEGTSFGFGLDVGYTWLLGDNQHFAISMGAGATRLFGADLEDETGFLPIIRLVNVGVAF